MADFPVTCNVQGDYGYKVIVVDDDDTISELITKATSQVIGILVAPFPSGTVLEARIHGAEAPLPASLTIKSAKLHPMEAIDIYRGGGN